MQTSLGNLLLFNPLGKGAQGKIVEEMWVRTVPAGEILIQEGEVGLAASELYVVKTGKFEVSGTPQHLLCIGTVWLLLSGVQATLTRHGACWCTAVLQHLPPVLLPKHTTAAPHRWLWACWGVQANRRAPTA
jgi:hypothetical protein